MKGKIRPCKICDLVEVGIVILDLDLRVTSFNKTFPEMIGRSEILPGERIEELISVFKRIEGDRWLEEAIGRVKGEEGQIEDEVFFKPADEESIARQAKIKLTRLDPDSILLLLEDITETVRAERRAAQAEKMATIGRLAANLAHELNSPLDGAMRYVRFLLEDMYEDDPRRKYVSRIKDALERMDRTIKSLLYFARGKTQTLKPADLNEMVRQTISFFEDQIQKRGIEVVEELDERIPRILHQDMEQVLANLIKNAVQAMPEGGVLTVRTRFDENTRSIILQVIDTGVGIPPEMLQNIFLPFFTTKQVGEGTGLGLSICRGIVERYGGEIRIDSKVGRGTTVTIRIPLQT